MESTSQPSSKPAQHVGQNGLFATFWGQLFDPLLIKGFFFEVAQFLTGGKKTALMGPPSESSHRQSWDGAWPPEKGPWQARLAAGRESKRSRGVLAQKSRLTSRASGCLMLFFPCQSDTTRVTFCGQCTGVRLPPGWILGPPTQPWDL